MSQMLQKKTGRLKFSILVYICPSRYKYIQPCNIQVARCIFISGRRRRGEERKTNGTDWFPAEAAAARPAVSRPGFVTGGRKRSHPLITQLKWTGNVALYRRADRCHPTRRQRYYYRRYYCHYRCCYIEKERRSYWWRRRVRQLAHGFSA